MKHGPIALIDENMPVVAIAPDDARVREDARQPSGSEGARRKRHRRHERGRPDERDPGPADDMIVPMPRTSAAAHADRHDDSDAAARVLHRRAPRMRRRSAAQPRQERDGGVAGRLSSGPADDGTLYDKATITDGLVVGAQSRTAGRCSQDRGPLPHPGGRRIGQDARHRPSDRAPRQRRALAARPHSRRHVHEQGGRGDALARRGAAGHGLPQHVDLHVPRAVRRAAASRSAADRALQGLRHLRFERPVYAR